VAGAGAGAGARLFTRKTGHLVVLSWAREHDCPWDAVTCAPPLLAGIWTVMRCRLPSCCVVDNSLQHLRCVGMITSIFILMRGPQRAPLGVSAERYRLYGHPGVARLCADPVGGVAVACWAPRRRSGWGGRLGADPVGGVDVGTVVR